jgi:cyclic pyranopterin phosphate synthase
MAKDAERHPLDTRGRPITDLRISVTDRCNFRCIYCMPRTVFGRDFEFLPRAELLTFEEITRVATVFVGLGVRKIRVTGGEPLVRKGIEDLIGRLAAIPDLQDVALTTNGSLLAGKAAELARAGLNRVTVSLDALDDHVFKRMNDADFPVAKVLAGIDAARAAGLGPIKVNMVVRRGVNDGEIEAMCEYFRASGDTLRFIEYMDVGSTNGWRLDDVVPAADIVSRISRRWPLEPLDPTVKGEVASRYRYLDGAGEIGIISSVTRPFCATCVRARLSAKGELFTCLFANQGHDLRDIIRSGADDTELERVVAAIWRRRGDRYSEIRSALTSSSPKVEMSYIGG